MPLYCQLCGAPNAEGHEFCVRCGAKLLIVSGPSPEADPELTEEMLILEQQELEEHILERITALEEALRQLAGAVSGMAERTAQVEHNLTVTHAGIEVLGQLLESHGVLSRAELADEWERSAGRELVSQDLARRFRDRLPRILSQARHAGHDSFQFRRQLRVLELALLGRQPETAQEQMIELLRSAPANDELWSILGELAFETGDMEAALVAFQRVLELRGRHFETLIYVGTVLSDLGRLDEAESVFREAVELEPDSFLPRFTLGALELSRGHSLKALEQLGGALDLEELPQLWHLVGICHLNLGHPGRAVTALRRAVEMAPNFEDAIYHLGLAYLRRGWNRLALDTFQQVLDLDPHRLQYQETVRLLSLKPPTDLPEEAGRLAEEAEAALERGRPEAALQRLEQATEIAPGNTALRATAALLASSLGRPRAALRHAHAVLAAPAEPSPYTAAAIVALLESLRHAGRRLAARRLASRLYATGPDSLSRGLAAYELALVEAELGTDLESARQLAMESLKITPRELQHYPLGALGEIALKRGHFQEAIQYLEQAAESAPRPILFRQLAVARLATGDTGGAEAALAAAEDHPAGGLDEELLVHVHRVGAILGGLARRCPSKPNPSRGG